MPRFNPKKILVPVDFSKYSLEALRAAVDMAQIRKAELTVLHISEEPAFPGTYGQASVAYANWDTIRNQVQEDAKRELEAMVSEATSGQKVECINVWGNPVNEILQFAEKGKFDLIVMSTHGRSGLSRMVMGSVAEQVIRHAHCPVFVLRGQD
jgi:nucleotide-binding universal stress UspA family protein